MENSTLTTKKSGYAGRRIHTGFSSLIVIAILVIIQLISSKHNIRKDVTQNKRHSLSEQTVKILTNLDQDITAYCFVSEAEPLFMQINDLLKQYAATSERFSFQFIDIDREPLKVEQYHIDPKEAYSVTVLTTSDGYRKVTTASENDLTNAILKVTRGDAKKTIYLLTGHGEKDSNSEEAMGCHSLKAGLENANYGVAVLNLLAEKSIPDDCAALAMIGPQIDPTEAEFQAIRAYLAQGGDLLLTLDPQVSCPNLTQFIAEYGIIAGNDLIVDPNGFQHVLQPIIGEYADHPITRDFRYLVVFNLARSITIAEEELPGMQVLSLAKTSEKSWAETDLTRLDDFQPELDETKDLKGPVSIAAISESDPSSASSDAPTDATKPVNRTKLIVFGDADFTDNYFFVANPNHAAFILNAFHYLTDESDLIAIPPVETLHQPLNLTPSQIAMAFWIPVVLLPLMIFVYGWIRIYERRKAG